MLNNNDIYKLILNALRFQAKTDFSNIVKNKLILGTLLYTYTTKNTIGPRGQSLYEAKRYGEALTVLNRNLSLDREHKSTIYHKGVCLYYMGEYYGALHAFIKLEELTSHYTDASHYAVKCRNMLNGQRTMEPQKHK
jgi:tetratricopeptide (TPR) repeat protein